MQQAEDRREIKGIQPPFLCVKSFGDSLCPHNLVQVLEPISAGSSPQEEERRTCPVAKCPGEGDLEELVSPRWALAFVYIASALLAANRSRRVRHILAHSCRSLFGNRVLTVISPWVSPALSSSELAHACSSLTRLCTFSLHSSRLPPGWRVDL